MIIFLLDIFRHFNNLIFYKHFQINQTFQIYSVFSFIKIFSYQLIRIDIFFY